MSRVNVTITMSLDGFVAGPGQSEQDPLGIGGDAIDAPGVTHIRYVRDDS
jgi:hypothetical protein